MRHASRFLGVLITAILATSSVSQAGSFAVVGAGNFAQPSIENVPSGKTADTYSSKLGIGGGALMAFNMSQWTSLEVGALYVNRKYDDTTTGSTDSLHVIQVPVLLRWWLHPMFSVALGGYYAHGVGSVSTEDSSATTTESFAAADYKANDYGLTGSVAIRLPITMSMRLLVDARYNYGLSNIYTDPSNTGLTEKNRDIQALVGLQFSMRSSR